MRVTHDEKVIAKLYLDWIIYRTDLAIEDDGECHDQHFVFDHNVENIRTLMWERFMEEMNNDKLTSFKQIFLK